MGHVIEGLVPFSESYIWTLQRQYFEERGAEAWRSGEVPHYVTSNLRQANAYAETILALYRDHARRSLAAGMEVEPIRILELGSGPGRLGYYLLRRLEVITARDGIDMRHFRLILTDLAASNVEAWAGHPRFAGYIEQGLLDMAVLDATQPGAIHLKVSGETIVDPRWTSPLVVIANYLFDSIPQEQVHVHDGVASRVGLSLSLPAELDDHAHLELLEAVELAFETLDQTDWLEPACADVVAQYAALGRDGYVLLPHLGLRCIAWLKQLSQAGLLLLSADKGSHRLEEVLSSQPHAFATHGSLSMTVNYHAMVQYCEADGGRAFFPTQYYSSVNTGCFLLLDSLEEYGHTWLTCMQQLDGPGPDSYFTLYRFMRQNMGQLEMKDILSGLRVSLFDSHQLGIFLPRIAGLLPVMQPSEAADLLHVIGACWDNYFPLGEGLDLAQALGSLCYTLDAYEWALFYFSQSTDIYGAYTGTFYNMAICYHMLGEDAVAKALLEKVVANDPGNAEAQALLAGYVVEVQATV